jgi:predicted TIM-barrel fold metal-dependent hydrolase
MDSEWMISADSHVIEPPDLWERVDRDYRDRVPRLVADADADWIYLDDARLVSFTVGAQVGKRFKGLEHLKSSGRWADVPPAAYEPAAYLDENETDGVWGAVLYPTVGFLLYTRVTDSGLLSALARAFNDWLGEFCAENPGRLKGIAILNLDDVDGGVAELQRARRRGLAGALIPMDQPDYSDPTLDGLWAAAQDLEMPLSFHTGGRRTCRGAFDRNLGPMILERVLSDYNPRKALTEILFSGVLERFPRLRVGAVEFESAWVPHFLRRLDDTYTQNWMGNLVHRYADGQLPSDVFRSNIFVTFEEDELGLVHRDMIGSGGLMWSNDYPHTESTFPRSREIVDRLMAGLGDDERRRLTVENARQLYGFASPSEVALSGPPR